MRYYLGHLSKNIQHVFSRFLASPHLSLYLFLLSIIIIFTIKIFQFPVLTYRAEMFGENGTNFFFHAYEQSFLENLPITDAGYLPITQRLITLVLVKGLHIITYYNFVSQWIALLLISIFSSLINLGVYKKLCSSALIRFIIGIALGLISDFELNVFMNFIYFGFFFLIWAWLLEKEKLHTVQFSLLSVFSAMILLSKGQFIIFIPLYVAMIGMSFIQKKYTSLLYYCITLGAGLLQFFVITTNIPKNNESLKLFLLPYYGIKTLYYLVLTYKHVFFGYVTKEPYTIISVVMLFVLFGLAIRTLILKKEKYMLSLFFFGNFIAVCSLFLTIVLYSNTNPNIKKITKTAVTAASPVAATNDMTVSVYENAQKTKNIFDEKHHANARALFFSNAIIFLVGICVLLTIFPKKRDKLIFLAFILFTSGAFAQIQPEAMYTDKRESFSQWQYYHPLLSHKAYCIPINNYPFLLHKNCDYLLHRSEKTLASLPEKVTRMSLSEVTTESKNWMIQSIMLINKSQQFTHDEALRLYGYDGQGKLIGKATQLVPADYTYVYFLFEHPIKGIETIEVRNKKNNPILFVPSVLIFGTTKNNTIQKIEY